LLDVAGVAGRDQLEEAVAAAQEGRLVREPDLWVQLERSRGCRGAAALRGLLEPHRTPAHVRSKAEQLMLRHIRDAGLAEALVNERLGRWRPDFLWHAERVVAEFDSSAFHTDIRSFRRDREKGNELQLEGFLVLRFTWHELTRTPELLVARIRDALARGSRD
jgi:very-short-patch-repair endonuclease